MPWSGPTFHGLTPDRKNSPGSGEFLRFPAWKNAHPYPTGRCPAATSRPPRRRPRSPGWCPSRAPRTRGAAPSRARRRSASSRRAREIRPGLLGVAGERRHRHQAGEDRLLPGLGRLEKRIDPARATPYLDSSPATLTSSSTRGGRSRVVLDLRSTDSLSTEWISRTRGSTCLVLRLWRWPMKSNVNGRPSSPACPPGPARCSPRPARCRPARARPSARAARTWSPPAARPRRRRGRAGTGGGDPVLNRGEVGPRTRPDRASLRPSHARPAWRPVTPPSRRCEKNSSGWQLVQMSAEAIDRGGTPRARAGAGWRAEGPAVRPRRPARRRDHGTPTPPPPHLVATGDRCRGRSRRSPRGRRRPARRGSRAPCRRCRPPRRASRSGQRRWRIRTTSTSGTQSATSTRGVTSGLSVSCASPRSDSRRG